MRIEIPRFSAADYPDRYRSVIDYRVYLEEKDAHIRRIENSIPGLEYWFEGNIQYWRVTDAAAYAEFWVRLGYSEETAASKVRTAEENPVASDQTGFVERFKYNHRGLLALFGTEELETCELIFTRIPFIDAGAVQLEDGASAIAIPVALANLQRWSCLKTWVERHLPMDAFYRSETATEFKWSPSELKELVSNCRALRMLSQIIVGDFDLSQSVEWKDDAGLTLVKFEGLYQSPGFVTNSTRRSNWFMADLFLLCHELGHVALGHTKEIRSWYGIPASFEVRASRRQEMEFHADSYAMVHSSMLMAAQLGRPYASPFPDDLRKVLKGIDEDPHSYQLFFTPIIDLMLMLALGQRNPFEEDHGTYPSFRKRLAYLLNKDPDSKSHEVEGLSTYFELIWRFSS